MKIKIIAVGKLKENYLKQGIQEYAKRLGTYCQFDIIEVADEKAPEQLSDKEMQQIKAKEATRILAKISEQDNVVALAIEGQLVSSESLADYIEQSGIQGQSKICFVIGGSLGLCDSVKKRANTLVSFGRITLPHQLMRLVLTEQVYRSFRIIHKHAYHK